MAGLSGKTLTKGMLILVGILVSMVTLGAVGTLGPLIVGAIQNFALDGSVNVTTEAVTAINSTGNSIIGLFSKVVAPATLIIGLVGLVVLLSVFGFDKIFSNMFGGKKKGKGGFRME